MVVENALSYFMEKNMFINSAFSDGYIIIDGNGLIENILNCITGDIIAYAFSGGDYCEFQRKIVDFFQKLKKCNIRALVVMDGATPLYLKEKKIEEYEFFIDNCNACSDSQLRIWYHLSREVFVSTIQSFRDDSTIMLIQAPYQAGDVIIFLSYRFNFPILSRNSDFFFHRNPVLLLTDVRNLHIYLLDSGRYALIFKILYPEHVKRKFNITNDIHYQLAPLILGNELIPPAPLPSKWSFVRRTRQSLFRGRLEWISMFNSYTFFEFKELLDSSLDNEYSSEINMFIEKILQFNKVPNYHYLPYAHYCESVYIDSFYGWYIFSISKFYNQVFDFHLKPGIGERELNIYLTGIDWRRPICEKFKYISESAFDVEAPLTDLIHRLFDRREKITLILPKKIDSITKIEKIDNIVLPFTWKDNLDFTTDNDSSISFVNMLKLKPDQINSLATYLHFKSDRTLVIALIILHRKKNLSSNILKSFLICLFKHSFINNETERVWVNNWIKIMENQTVESLHEDIIHFYNQYQIILSSLICLIRLIRIEEWNPSLNLSLLNGFFIGRLFVIANNEQSQYLVDNFLDRFPKLKALFEYILTY